MSRITMNDLDLRGKRVLIRADLNVPIKDGKVASDIRIKASLPTMRMALEAGARVMAMSHLGRPTEGQYEEEFSMAPVAGRLAELTGRKVPLLRDYLSGVAISDGELVLFENVRFNKGEKKNDEGLSRHYAALCDVFVMDAFGTAHRAEASTHGAGMFAPLACSGLLMEEELSALEKALANPARPLVAIIGGSKVSTKLTILDALTAKVDKLIVGGGIANNFLMAAGFPIGRSLHEPELVEEAARLLAAAKAKGSEIPLPSDVVVAREFSADAPGAIKKAADVAEGDMILDIGPATAEKYRKILLEAKTVVWNGPVGVFEFPAFSKGTQALCAAVADSSAFSIAGGGDTLAAVDQFNVADKISYLSTAGGAFLEFLEGKTLPAVEMLEKRGR